jgi:hypothetical protein
MHSLDSCPQPDPPGHRYTNRYAWIIAEDHRTAKLGHGGESANRMVTHVDGGACERIDQRARNAAKAALPACPPHCQAILKIRGGIAGNAALATFLELAIAWAFVTSLEGAGVGTDAIAGVLHGNLMP